MAAGSKPMRVAAERRFPCRIKIAVPAGGFGAQLTQMEAWLDENCGADGWAMTPAGLHGVANDAVAIHFLDAAAAVGFVSRWCGAARVDIADGAFRLRRDRPAPRVHAKPHRTF